MFFHVQTLPVYQRRTFAVNTPRASDMLDSTADDVSLWQRPYITSLDFTGATEGRDPAQDGLTSVDVY